MHNDPQLNSPHPTSQNDVCNRADRTLAAEANRDSERRNQRLLATLAHELRNPLGAISNLIQFWQQLEHDAAEMELVQQSMERQVRQMSRLIEDLLDVSRIAEGKLEVRKQAVKLSELVNSAVEDLRPLIQDHGQDVTVALPSFPVLVQGDDTRLRQVFGNLIHNAAKYTGISGRIWVSVEMEEQVAIVRVRDNGPGIPDHMLSRVFEMFTQLEEKPDSAQGGLGIGLALVKSFVEMHGGDVAARSEGPGRGSEFIVRLPAMLNEDGIAAHGLNGISKAREPH